MFCASFSSLLHPLESQKLPSKNKQCQHAESPRRLNFPAAPRKSNKKLLESDLIFDRKHQVKHVEQRFLCNKSHTGNAGVPHTAQEPGWLRLAQAQQPGGGSGFLWSLGGSNTSACPVPTMRTSGAPGHPAEESGWGRQGGSLEMPSTEALGRSSPLWLPGAFPPCGSSTRSTEEQETPFS